MLPRLPFAVLVALPLAWPAVARADEYDKHIAAGDKLESAGKWKDALAEFEAALALHAGDLRALNEIGFTAFHAGSCARGKEASLAALHGNEDANARGVSLYNLGLCVEADDPRAATALFLASYGSRVNDTVGKALLAAAKTGRTKKPTKDGTALLAQLKVRDVDLDPVQKQLPTPLDWALLDVLVNNGGSFHMVAMHSTQLDAPVLACTEAHGSSSCTNTPRPDEQDSRITATGVDAHALIGNLAARKIVPVKKGDALVYTVDVRCMGSRHIDDDPPAVDCTVAPH